MANSLATVTPSTALHAQVSAAAGLHGILHLLTQVHFAETDERPNPDLELNPYIDDFVDVTFSAVEVTLTVVFKDTSAAPRAAFLLEGLIKRGFEEALGDFVVDKVERRDNHLAVTLFL